MTALLESLYPNWGQFFSDFRPLMEAATPAGQELLLIDTTSHGRVLLLDGVVQLTERGNTSYHEMMVHPALFALQSPRRVLIIGGGDGGTLKEVLRHPNVEEVVLVEIDQNVITFCSEYFPKVGDGAFNDPRVSVVIDDGSAYLYNRHDTFDVILVDSTDPTPNSSDVLFTNTFYRDCRNNLGREGLLVVQAGVPRLQGEELRMIAANLREADFDNVDCLMVDAPDYVGGAMALMWGMSGLSLDRVTDDATMLRIRNAQFVSNLGYFNDEMQAASFALPNYIKRLLNA